MSYPIPPNEEERLGALNALQILDTPPDPRFDRITRLAARQLGAETAVVSLVDADRQWFKSCFNLDATETPREVAFCAHTIMTPSVMVVHDACADPRFADNPLVTGPLGIRFYAGAPLVTPSGEALGTLCLIGYKPQSFTDADCELLQEFAGAVMDALELHRVNLALQTHAQELAETNRSLALANSQLEHFNRIAAHDFKSPLRTICSLTEILQEHAEEWTDPEDKEILRMIGGAGRRVLRLTDDLLQLIRAGHALDRTLEGTDLDAVMANVLADLAVPIQQTEAEIIIAPLPTVLGRAALLRQLFGNLVANSLKYRKRDQPARIRIAVSDATGDGSDGDGHITIAVSDNGQGFPASQRDGVFEPFRRLHTTETQGSGLGLAICRTIVEQHGGKIWADAEQGNGATFYVQLKRADGPKAGSC